MAFVASDGSGDTADAARHGFLWVRLSTPSATEAVTTWQSWIKTTTMTGMKVFSWTDLRTLALELFHDDASVENESVLLRPHGPECIDRTLAVAIYHLGPNPAAASRAEAAKYLQKLKRTVTGADKTAVTVTARDLLTLTSPPMPPWQAAITYEMAATAGGGQVTKWLSYYDATVIRGASTSSARLNEVRYAIASAGRTPVNTAPPNAPPIPPAHGADQPTMEAHAAAAATYIATPPADNVPPDTVAHAVCTALSDNKFAAENALLLQDGEGPARVNGAAAEVMGLIQPPTGETPSIRARVRSVLTECAPTLDLGKT